MMLVSRLIKSPVTIARGELAQVLRLRKRQRTLRMTRKTMNLICSYGSVGQPRFQIGGEQAMKQLLSGFATD
jgi:hypothetical protein